MLKEIHLPIFDINIILNGNNGHSIISNLHNKDINEMLTLIKYTAAIDGLETFILCCASSGVNIESPEFLKAIQDTVQVINVNL